MSMTVQEYLDRHKLSLRIEEAVNAAVRAKSDEPIAFIARHLQRAAPSVILSVKGRMVLDARGEPTVEVEVGSHRGKFRASVPTGVTSGIYEAVEVRDGDEGEFFGRGVQKAVGNVSDAIAACHTLTTPLPILSFFPHSVPDMKRISRPYHPSPSPSILSFSPHSVPLRYEAVEVRDGDEGELFGRGVQRAAGNVSDAITAPPSTPPNPSFSFHLSPSPRSHPPSYEAVEVRDGDEGEFFGRGVQRAVANVSDAIAAAVVGRDPREQGEIDRLMAAELDQTDNKGELGANAILAVSLAMCRAGAAEREALAAERFGAAAAALVTDDGSLGLPLESIRDGLQLLTSAVSKAGHSEKVKISVHAALGGRVTDEGHYDLGMQQLEHLLGGSGGDISMTSANSSGSSLEQVTVQQLIDVYQQLCSEFPIVSIEDPFDQEDFDATQALSEAGFTQVVGNDLLVSNAKRLAQAIERRTCSGIAIKLPLIGTLSEALEVAKAARAAGWTVAVAGGVGRQGDTEDCMLADVAVGMGAQRIKAGGVCRGERCAKYNQLLRIEEELGSKATYAAATAVVMPPTSHASRCSFTSFRVFLRILYARDDLRAINVLSGD
ncbi:unnamed protein product [Closterium sp. Yama58-4]|nr:unnamed protein product [Closterium sp. Yama58-4]